MNLHRPPIAREPVELSLDTSLVADAKAFGIDLAGAAEEALRQKVSRERARRWAEENREAIEASNARIEREGLWCDEYRLF